MDYKSVEEIQKRIEELKEEQQRLEAAAVQMVGNNGTRIYSIRPAGRHVLTIGEELIQDKYAAIIELVKNAYDADSPSARITFSKEKNERVKIVVSDLGHGMSPDDIVYKWLVPSTDNKKDARISPRGRIMQGRKGIGRFAASILGNSFEMETVAENGVCTVVQLDWRKFEKADYLDQVGIEVKTSATTRPTGTRITILCDEEQSNYWDEKNIKKLVYELKRLVSPKGLGEKEDFKILLGFEKFYNDPQLDVENEIKAFPILELYDYRISGEIQSDGTGILTYECQKVVPSQKESISFSYGRNTQCGSLNYDVRVYDREGSSIEMLIKRGDGLKNDNTGSYVGKNEAKQLLNMVNGIGVYRNGFRIRPLGDPDFDWLTLDKQRVQNPSKKIGSDQVSGRVDIQSEELSNLEEKSARDGLKENEAYESLRNITNQVIALLEERRFLLRRMLGILKPKQMIEKQLNSLYDYSTLKKTVEKQLKDAGLNAETITKVDILIEEEEKKNNNTVEEIRKAIAIYQGQATVGKIINVLLHEGRRPLNYFKGQLPNLAYYESKFKEQKDEKSAEKIVEISAGMENSVTTFAELFSRIDPLASKRRTKKVRFNVKKVLVEVLAVFEKELKKGKITSSIDCDDSVDFFGWRQDFYAIFTNLIDNSIYWISEKNGCGEISVEVQMDVDSIVINYRDSGPGISKELLSSGVIFEPEFSTKPNGSGLGLAIAGEAALRNGLVLSAEESETGAHFILMKEEEEANGTI